ncbi:MAG: hypothetical protein FWG67_09215 [Defluviitaleaceae bacterium]|nr:hypothetical protein [Defluviitaleaceae bacterium]
MKTRYKFLLVVLLLWIGMSYEGARNQEPSPNNHRAYTTLNEQIRAYEAGLIAGGHFDDTYDRGPATLQQGNLIARTGRNVGHALQTVVREMLRGVARFFDGVIS